MAVLLRSFPPTWAGAVQRLVAQLPVPAPWRWKLEMLAERWTRGLGLDALTLDDPAHPSALHHLDGEAVLDLSFDVPRIALASLPELLALEIESATPFSAADVAAAYRLTPADGDKLRCQILLTPLAVYEEVSGADMVILEAGGIAMRLPGRHQGPWWRANRRRTARRWAFAMAAATLLMTAPHVYAWRIEQMLQQSQPVLQQARAAAAAAAETKRQLEALTLARSRTGALIGGKPAAVTVIATLTEALADSISLTALRSEGTRWRIEGIAASASEAVSAIAALPFVRDAQFDSPVTVMADGREGFAISYDVYEADAP